MRASQPVDQNDYYQTADMYYAAYLKVAGVPLMGTATEGRRVFFQFESSPNLDDLRRDYYNRRGKVPALTYSEEVKVMKSLTAEAQQSARR